MTTHTPETQVSTTTRQRPGDSGQHAKLPHEQDQSTDMTGAVRHPEMEQAFRDVSKGLTDTDARGRDGRPLGQKKPMP